MTTAQSIAISNISDQFVSGVDQDILSHLDAIKNGRWIGTTPEIKAVMEEVAVAVKSLEALADKIEQAGEVLKARVSESGGISRNSTIAEREALVKGLVRGSNTVINRAMEEMLPRFYNPNRTF